LRPVRRLGKSAYNPLHSSVVARQLPWRTRFRRDRRRRAISRNGGTVNTLLSLSRWIDGLNQRVGKALIWLVLAAVLISAVNAIVRKAFDMSSNAFLETQWYLFSAIFLLCAPYTLLRNEHIRIDVVAGRLSNRAQTWIDVFGTVFFLLPMAVMITYLSWLVFVRSWNLGEVSTNAGGLVIWPARLLVPVGFFLLVLQGVSQLMKLVAWLRGEGPDPNLKHDLAEAEKLLAEAILRERGEKA
jgi:TRAP-type mannitol/chloroaromatic compound transport system permease small subunit